MKWNWIFGLLFGAILTIPASAQIGVYIGVAPPRARYERRGPLPGPGYAWVDGYWAPHGHRYQWVAGRWDRPPYEGAAWSRPHYEHSRQGWQLHEGHWDHDGHDRDQGRGHGNGEGREHHDH